MAKDNILFLYYRLNYAPINNSSIIGANAVINNSNEMVLGDNNEYVGIGYSNVSTYPQGYLSVDKTDQSNASATTIAGYFHNGDQQSQAASSFEKKGIYAFSVGYFSNGHDGGSILSNIG